MSLVSGQRGEATPMQTMQYELPHNKDSGSNADGRWSHDYTVYNVCLLFNYPCQCQRTRLKKLKFAFQCHGASVLCGDNTYNH